MKLIATFRANPLPHISLVQRISGAEPITPIRSHVRRSTVPTAPYTPSQPGYIIIGGWVSMDTEFLGDISGVVDMEASNLMAVQNQLTVLP